MEYSMQLHVGAINPLLTCEICEGIHATYECSLYVALNALEQVNYTGNVENDPYSNMYDSEWNDYPEFYWNQGGQQTNSNMYYQQQCPLQHQEYSEPSALEIALEKLAQSTSIFMQETTDVIQEMQETRENFQRQEAAIEIFEVQVEQIAKKQSEGPMVNILPSITEVNPQECCNSMHLCSGEIEEVQKEAEKVEEDLDTPCVFEKSILATERDPLNVHEEELMLEIDDNKLVSNVFKESEDSARKVDCLMVYVVHPSVPKSFEKEDQANSFEFSPIPAEKSSTASENFTELAELEEMREKPQKLINKKLMRYKKIKEKPP